MTMTLTQVTTGGVDENINIDSNTLKVDGTNNRVGIGTASPGKDLEVYNTTGPTISLNDGGQYKSYFTLLGNDLEVRGSSGNIEFYTGSADGGSSTQRLRIDSNGRVAIGTDSPPVDPQLTVRAANAQISAYSSAGGTSSLSLGDVSNHDDGYISYVNGNGFQQMRFHTAATEQMRLDSSGRLLIGLISSTGSHKLEVNGGTDNEPIKVESSDAGAYVRFEDNDTTGSTRLGAVDNDFKIDVNSSERMRIDASGRVGIKNASPSSQYFNDLVIGDGSSDHGITLHAGSNNSSAIAFSDATSGTGRYAGYIQYDHSSNSMRFYTNGGNERTRITSTGFTQFGGYLNETANHRINGIDDTQGNIILVVSGYQSSGGSSQDTAMFYSVNSGGSVSSNGAGLRMYKNTDTNRSINTAGTINASGADYAEYMTKAGNFTLAKGDICGINSEGKLTNVFADAISFVVKSTDPSYVGGDKWHETVGEEPGGYEDTRTEEEIAAAKVVYEEALEAARQLVDRIAFSGQVPVNVTGATPGQHIIPTAAADGSIEGTAKAEADLTMAEYMSSVGKVIAIENDGRAKIIVKVA